MDLRAYLVAIRKGWWIVITATILGAAGGAIENVRAEPAYAAHLTFYVGTPRIDSTNPQSSETFAQDRATSYARLLSSQALADKVVNSAKLVIPAARVAREVTAAAQLNTVLIDVTVRDRTPKRALAIASAIATDFPKLISALDGVNAKAAAVTLSVVSGPGVNNTPVSPRKTLNIGFGLTLGLIIGLFLAVLRELLDTTIRTSETLQEISAYPTLASIGYESDAKVAPLIVENGVYSQGAEAFRKLRTNLTFIDAVNPVRVLVVTSAVGGEGKSITAANLAIAFAENGKRVLLIEADLRRPRVSRYMGLENTVGLTNLLARQVELEDVIQPWGGNDLGVLASGPIPPNPSELLGGQQMQSLVAHCRDKFDLVIIDTPPLLPVTDAAVVAPHADGVLVVFRHGKTKRDQLRLAVRSLDAVNARILGCVLNMRPIRRADGSGYESYSGALKSEPAHAASTSGTDTAASADPPIVVDPQASTATTWKGRTDRRTLNASHNIQPHSSSATVDGIGFSASRLGQPKPGIGQRKGGNHSSPAASQSERGQVSEPQE